MLDHWIRRCSGNGRCGRHRVDHWRRRCIGIGRCGRHLGPAPLPGGGRRGRYVFCHFHILRSWCVCSTLRSWTICSTVRIWMGSSVWASASTRRDLWALWCVADTTAHQMANCSHHDLKRLSRLRRAEHACLCSSPCAAISNDGLPLGLGTIGYEGYNTCEPELLWKWKWILMEVSQSRSGTQD